MADKDTKTAPAIAPSDTVSGAASGAASAPFTAESFVDKYGGPAQHKAYMKGELAHVKADKPDSIGAFCDAFANTPAKHRAMEKDLKSLLGVVD